MTMRQPYPAITAPIRPNGLERQLDGLRLSDEEIVGLANILLIAGHITTTSLLGNELLCLDEHPDVQSALKATLRQSPRRSKRCFANGARFRGWSELQPLT
jgi:cytochrome P450